jgi:hypothetical protein
MSPTPSGEKARGKRACPTIAKTHDDAIPQNGGMLRRAPVPHIDGASWRVAWGRHARPSDVGRASVLAARSASARRKGRAAEAPRDCQPNEANGFHPIGAAVERDATTQMKRPPEGGLLKVRSTRLRVRQRPKRCPCGNVGMSHTRGQRNRRASWPRSKAPAPRSSAPTKTAPPCRTRRRSWSSLR